MIYVDLPTWKKSPKGRKTYSHMVADTREELVKFATSIGVKPHFWHRAGIGGNLSHYDITSEQYQLAVAGGAQTVDSREIVRIAKIMNGVPNVQKTTTEP